MKRYFVATVLVSVIAVAAYGQETTVRTKTKSEGQQGQLVTYSGCVQSGPQTRTYTLNKIVPTSRTTTTEPGADGAPGTITTTTTWALTSEQVQLQEYVGHKVEVTGMFVPAGDSKTKTKTKVDHDEKKVETKTENGMPEFHVISVQHLADSCQ